MSVRTQESWLSRLARRLRGHPAAQPVSGLDRRGPQRDVTVVPAQIVAPVAPGPRTTEDWRDLVAQGRRMTVSWDGGAARGAITAHGVVRLLFDDAIWIWLDRDLPEADRPAAGQAIQVLVPREDAMRMIPGRLVETSRGGSLQVAVSGRVARIQRRDDVRAQVDLPPMSAVRLGPDGRPIGLLGLRVMDLSAGGIRVFSDEPLAAGERLRLVLRLDDGQPLNPTVEILVGGVAAQGRFSPMPDRERRRIVQFVYHQELAERRRAQAADPR